MTKKQWDLLNRATAMAHTLANSESARCKRQGVDATMYEQWAEEAQAAIDELIQMGAKARVFTQHLEEVA